MFGGDLAAEAVKVLDERGVEGEALFRQLDRGSDDVLARQLAELLVERRQAWYFFFSSRRRHTRLTCDWSSDVCSSDLLLLLDLDLGGAADLDDGDTAGELGQALLELLAVVVRGGLLDLGADLGDAALEVGLLARTVDDRGVLLLDDDLLGLAEHVERDVLELDAEILGDQLTAGQDRHVLEHRLAAIAEARRLDGGDLQATTQLVDDQGGESLALDVLSHDQQRLARLHDRLEHRQHRLQARELLLEQQDIGALQLGDHLVGVGDEVRREIAAAELHALDDVELGAEALGLLDRDHALVADLLHRLGDHLADRLVAVGRDRADLGDLVRAGALLGPPL